MKKAFENTPTIITVAFSAMAALTIYVLMAHINVVISPSIDHRLFWSTDAVPDKNDYALFELNDKNLGVEGELLTKKIICGPGDTLMTTGLEYTCNNKLIGFALEKNQKKKQLSHMVFNGKIPEGKGFAFGSNLKSFDSRYFGLIDLNKAKKQIVIF